MAVLQQAVHVLNGSQKANSLNALLYGAIGTGAIALVYTPAYAAVSAAAAALCDQVLPFPQDADTVSAWKDNRTSLEGYLGLDKSTLDRLKTGVAVLSPLIADATSFLT